MRRADCPIGKPFGSWCTLGMPLVAEDDEKLFAAVANHAMTAHFAGPVEASRQQARHYRTCGHTMSATPRSIPRSTSRRRSQAMQCKDIDDAHVVDLARRWWESKGPCVFDALVAEGIPPKLATAKIIRLSERRPPLLEYGVSTRCAWPVGIGHSRAQ